MMKIDDILTATYVEGGRGPSEFDCFGLFAELFRRKGEELPGVVTPPKLEDRALLIQKAIDEDHEWIKLSAPEPYCAVALRMSGFVTHIGMVMEDRERFIHIRKKLGVTVERLDSPQWRSRIAGYYRHV